MRRLLIVLATVTLPISGCGGSDMDDAKQKLPNRPSLEQVVEKYRMMQYDIRHHLSQEMALKTWTSDPDSGGEAFCADPYEDSGGEIRSLKQWTHKGNIPDNDWEQAKSIVVEVTKSYDFYTPETVYNEPGNHQITASDDYGASYDFGTAVNTVLRMSTGCHLPEAKHPNTQSIGVQENAPRPEWVPAKNDPHGITWLPGRPHTS